jgi:hypothetical protein
MYRYRSLTDFFFDDSDGRRAELWRVVKTELIEPLIHRKYRKGWNLVY